MEITIEYQPILEAPAALKRSINQSFTHVPAKNVNFCRILSNFVNFFTHFVEFFAYFYEFLRSFTNF
jgi:hypothetical protein